MVIFYFPCLLLLTMSSSYGFADITTSSPLSIRQSLSSPDGSFELGFFSPNSSQNHQYVGIWFKRVTPRVYVWVANRENPVTSSTASLTISGNGSLVLLDEKQKVLWSSGEEALTSNECRAELSNSGNLLLIDNVTGTYIWQSFEHPADTMLPLSSLMYDIPNNSRRVLTSWKSNTDPSPGEFLGELTTDVPPQGLVRKGSTPYWRSGPWRETRFSGIPEMDATYVNPLQVVQDVVNGTGVLTFCALRNYDVSYIKLTSNGSLDIHRSNGGTTGWIKHFQGPLSSCDLYGTCGPYGLCIRSVSTPTCKCLKGFVPKSDDEWNRGIWTRGCVRRTELSSCQENSSSTAETKDTTDRFYRVANIKPPDFYELASFGDAEQCRQGCLRNCSCSAFAYINGIGCLVWNQELLDTVQFSEGGDFLSIRLARSELAGSKRTKIIAASSISLCVCIILGLVAFGCWRYRLKENGEARAWESWTETGGVDLLDQDIAESESDSVEAVMRCVQIGLLCVQHQATDRPNIKQVVTMLTSTIDLPKPKQPMFVLDTSDEDSLSLKDDTMLKRHRSCVELLPHDVVELILEGLPVESLLRFKSVSKKWKSTIESQRFQEGQWIRRRQSRGPDFLCMCLNYPSSSDDDDDDDDDADLDTDAPRIGYHGDDGPDTDAQRTVVVGSSIVSTVRFPTSGSMFCYGSCDGLVCLYTLSMCTPSVSVVVNPATRCHRSFPLSTYQQLLSKKFRYPSPELGFGKDKVRGTYKPVWLYNSSELGLDNVTTCEVFDFSTNAWRYVVPASPFRIHPYSRPPCI
ncbi:unnamed protein product [Thlaspi arvense]|uniref:Receptor-like serine/threonine-protein kinase n=1 Tax=Thlaspi arvense TaxID=13288 RepID=A0AAU9RD28_THLAR|nr:unnamed protein product [Thlaspi arvense]